MLAAAAAIIYCTGVFTAVYRHNQAVLANATYTEITGGGFIYNYRIADIRSGVTVGLLKALPEGTRLLAKFETANCGKIEVERTVTAKRRNYSFETPSLSGVVPKREYGVVLYVIDPETGIEIERHQKALKSSTAPKSMPSSPLTIGPGYHRAPKTALADGG